MSFQGGKEYIFAGGGNGTGIFRSTTGGAAWDNIGLRTLSSTECLTRMAMDPTDTSGDTLIVATNTDGAKVASQNAGPAKVYALTHDKTGAEPTVAHTVSAPGPIEDICPPRDPLGGREVLWRSQLV